MMFTQITVLLALVVGSFASSVDAEARTITCVKGAQIILARGTNEAYPGSLMLVANKVKAKVPESNVTSVHYPAVAYSPPYYGGSVTEGIQAARSLISQYVAQCGAKNIVLLGYSQGAQVITELLGGGHNQTALESKYKPYIKAAIAFADPSFVIGQPYDAGTATRSGRVARKDPKALLPYKDVLRSFCAKDDYFCDSGSDQGNGVHGAEVAIWATAATNFTVSRFS